MSSQLLQYIHQMKRGKLNLEVFCLGNVNDRARKKFSSYAKKIEWMIQDLKTEPTVTQELRDAIDLEYHSDVYVVDSITEKALLLSPDERDILETIIDCVLKGEEINIVYTDKNKGNETTN